MLDKLAFSLISDAVNELERFLGPKAFKTQCARNQVTVLTYLTKLSVEALTNMGYSGFAPQLVLRLASEASEAVNEHFTSPLSRINLKYCVSMARRCIRVGQWFSDLFSAIFDANRVEDFAIQLGVDSTAGKFYGEGLIRTSLCYQVTNEASIVSFRQLMRISSLIVKLVDIELFKESPFVVISEGHAVGYLVTGRRLEDAMCNWQRQISGAGEDVALILSLDELDGDEQIEGLREKMQGCSGIEGMIIGQDLPILSHFSVRVRQIGGFPVLACDKSEVFENINKQWRGKLVALDSSELTRPITGVNQLSKHEKSRGPPKSVVTTTGTFEVGNKFRIVTGDMIRAENCGFKAAVCQQLTEVCSKLGLKAPKCICLPFGSCEAVAGNEVMALSCEEKERAIRDHLKMPVEVGIMLLEVVGTVGSDFIMVRSSSNVEDMSSTVSGAGLYDSVVAVSEDIDDVWKGICRVWSSLYTARGVESRRAYGMERQAVYMGVLIQPLISGDWSFVAHTLCVRKGNRNWIYIEAAKGLGESLAGGGYSVGGGRPSRILIEKNSDEVVCESVSDFLAECSATRQGGRVVRWTRLSGHETSESFYEGLRTKLKALQNVEVERGCPQVKYGFLGDFMSHTGHRGLHLWQRGLDIAGEATIW